MSRGTRWRQCQDRGYSGSFGLFCTPHKAFFQLDTWPECNFTRGNSAYGDDPETLWSYYTCCCYKEPLVQLDSPNLAFQVVDSPEPFEVSESLAFQVDTHGRMLHFGLNGSVVIGKR